MGGCAHLRAGKRSMNGAIFALVACFLATIGARDQMLLAALTVRQGWRTSLVVMALATGAFASAIAAFVALEGVGLFNHKVQLIIAMLGLGMAGGESLLRRPRRIPDEPTNSLFAAMLVLLADQITDPARFIIVAFAIETGEPIPAALGGMMGCGAALVLGTFNAERLVQSKHTVPNARRLAGVLLLLAAIVIFLWDFFVVARS